MENKNILTIFSIFFDMRATEFKEREKQLRKIKEF